jgi:cysteine desulfurase/selenocysteine lyase
MLNTGYIYLDNGATTWKPEPVIKKINEYYNDFTANAHRGDYDISLRVDNEYEGARKIVADFINSDYKEVIFTSGTTDALNLVAEGYFRKHLQKDDEIIINYAEHASNVMPWFRLANDLGVKVKFAALNDSNALTLDSIKEVVSD